MRAKPLTETFEKRNKTALAGRSPREKNEAAFGANMITLAKSCRAYVFKNMLPSYIDEEYLDSGMQKCDLYKAIRALVLNRIDQLEKITASVNRNSTIIGNCITYISS